MDIPSLNYNEEIVIRRVQDPCEAEELLRIFENVNRNAVFLRAYSIASSREIGLASIYMEDERSVKVQMTALRWADEFEDEFRGAIQTLIAYLFTHLNISKVYTSMPIDDMKKRNFWNLTQFVEEGIIRSDACIDNKITHMRYMGILRHEFLRNQK